MNSLTTSGSRPASTETVKAVDGSSKNSSITADSKTENKAGNRPGSKTVVSGKPARSAAASDSKALAEDDSRLIDSYQSAVRVWPD